jgi:peptidoglycan/LPS O-acetylase OafA/YrhL
LQNDDAWVRWYKWIYYPTYSRLDGLLTGVSIAALFQFRPRLREKIQRYGNWFLLTGLVVLTAAYIICWDEMSYTASIFGFPLTDFGYGLIVMAAVCPTCFLYRFRSRITARIAAFSYGLYLVHKITIHLTQVHCTGIAKDGNLMLLLCIVTATAGAWLLNIAIERPFLLLRKKILNRKNAVLISRNTYTTEEA